ncbi:hypothetical protein CYLTODRAFT_493501 [Cylindrobasidium torrendii FP15055 ss-10]|uniref:Glycoside hydrolase family 76 protein n=1 Tax=Cylindrobasidium torrendii FP15055 ss-10 TaxID=1314674 RepID=A0A0D7B1C4_9AGAR|nr:hypothetical protein CYLTODRAFT_493501 [Cylindrobasidium torrendii FP15055 ss-10]
MRLHGPMCGLYSALFLLPVLAEEEIRFSVPSTWRKPNITQSWSEAQKTVTDAIAPVFASLNGVETGIDAMRAYTAYKSSDAIQVAQAAWDHGRNYTISSENVSQGNMSTKAFNIPKSCVEKSMVGGTFSYPDTNNGILDGSATAKFFTSLSSYLWVATQNQTYLTAAKESGAFLVDLIGIATFGNGKSGINAALNNSDCATDVYGVTDLQIMQAGVFIEGLALLPEDTEIQEKSVKSWRRILVNMVITTNKACIQKSGILARTDTKGDNNIAYGLGALYSNTVDGTMQDYIAKYLAVQYNAVIELAAKGNIYSGSWEGPAPTDYDHWNQTLAVYALVSGALTVRSPASSNNGTAPESPSGPSNDGKRHPSRVGLLVGGLVGGLALVLIAGLSIFLRRRRASDHNGELASLDGDEPQYKHGVPIPYTISSVRVSGSRLGALSPHVETPQPVEYSRKPPLGNCIVASNTRQRAGSPDNNAATVPHALATIGSGPNPESLPTDTIVNLLHRRLEREGRLGDRSSPPTYATDTRSLRTM